MPLTRLAPSPTGALHLGNARTFLVNWLLARQRGWRVLLRIEDLDGPRVKSGAARQAMETLAWLGMDWEQGPVYQSADLQPYQSALASLASQGIAYPCCCTRSQIAAASLSAPNAGDHDLRYSGACRPRELTAFEATDAQFAGMAWRLVAPDVPTTFVDEFAGTREYNVQQSVGDFLIATKAGLPGYQLAVVVDDARQAITHVVRGDDLLPSTPRQTLLFDLLKLGPPPVYFHLPLVIGEDGRRLAKRHGDTRIDYYRQQGASRERVLGLLAEWCGLGDRREVTINEFLARFDLDRLPADPIVFTQADDAWLLA